MQVTYTQFETFLFKSYDSKSTRSRKSFNIKMSTYFIQVVISIIEADSRNARCSSCKAAKEQEKRRRPLLPASTSLPRWCRGPHSPHKGCPPSRTASLWNQSGGESEAKRDLEMYFGASQMCFKTSPRGLHSPSRSAPCSRPSPGTLAWFLEVSDGFSLILVAGILAAHLSL